jgi:uracil-DNA glycosylase family 4
MPTALSQLQETIVTCTQCPRLITYCQHVASQKVRRFRHLPYWGKPVPSFGDPKARLVLIGLAPAAHGANRTGRAFTGDRSGAWLFDALHAHGFANQPTAEHRQDGLILRDAYITQVLHCAPPTNKPDPIEIARCRPYLLTELRLLSNLQIILPLGKIAFDATLNALQQLDIALPTPRPRFGHALQYQLANGTTLLTSYHPSQQNTQTGRLTRAMFHQVFKIAHALLSKKNPLPGTIS